MLWSGACRSDVLPSSRWLIGLMLIGWGLFNFIEGLIDHHLLGIHHVRQWGPNPSWDYGFLLSGPVLIVIGWLMVRSVVRLSNPATR